MSFFIILLTPVEEVLFLFFEVDTVSFFLLNLFDGELLLYFLRVVPEFVCVILAPLVIVKEGLELFLMCLVYEILDMQLTDPVEHAPGEGVDCFEDVLQGPAKDFQFVCQSVVLGHLLIVLPDFDLVRLNSQSITSIRITAPLFP